MDYGQIANNPEEKNKIDNKTTCSSTQFVEVPLKAKQKQSSNKRFAL